ncbi:hypothetical protein CAGGBEG34_370014 [Candidatus Glomeribacter gigasporarum BEG34]|uniref:Transmembrane protein n=1 Tax=Candidatus Glomeribacter gigasporarum BEG34 TaxID=1070319 RepID=G2JB64_9BURK|nr:hypothetical protein [Candidatus Glomeribacter gigasporarum]CCD30016.1 hypothetical protein CAGGBEG34_370014 [Candidatus Glomeribacter gigasporarum BEG34]
MLTPPPADYTFGPALQTLDMLHWDFRTALYQKHADDVAQDTRALIQKTLNNMQSNLRTAIQSASGLEALFSARCAAAASSASSVPDTDRMIDVCAQQLQDLQCAVQEIATLVEPPLPLSLPESLPPSSSLEASLPPSSTHPLQIILLTVLAVFIALTVFIMSVLIASGTPPSVVAQAVVLSALCFMSPFGCMMIHSSVLDDENRNAPARLQTSMQAESSEKSPDQYYEHALNAFTQALDTLAAQLSDLKKYDLGLQSQAQQTASSSTAACEATLNAA